MTTKLKIRILIMSSIMSWLLYSILSLYCIFLKEHASLPQFISILPEVFLSFFVISTYYYFWLNVKNADSLNFTDLLWKVFYTGLVTTLCSLFIQFFFKIFSGSNISENPMAINFLYSIGVGLVTLFLMSTFVIWKRLILYQRTKKLLRLWAFFEIALCIAILCDFFVSQTKVIAYTSFGIMGSVAIVLVLNLKWVAYLNFKQKWKGILLILLSLAYFYHFSQNLDLFEKTGSLYINILDRAFFAGVIVFLILYAIISILVILFNLPTSSVFEQKVKEAIDFQRLTMAIPQGETKDHTYEILIDSAMSAVFADAGWIEIKDNGILKQTFRNLDYKKIEEIKMALEHGNVKNILNYSIKQNSLSSNKFIDKLKSTPFRSIIAFPIIIKDEQVGLLCLLNEVADAFNNDMISIITTFVNQASISMENLSLLQESLETERYKQQLTIAKNVQKSLLPTSLLDNKNIKIDAFSEAADEVGGDYYDIIQHSENKYSLIIADVSGKGTSAAFNMAQMKGVFHSLATEEISPKKFNIEANRALSNCLEKSSFITASYFKIDTEKKTIEFSRAGHCPCLYYHATNASSNYIEIEGMGIGILRNKMYEKYVTDKTIDYQSGDMLFLYTDGISEAMDNNGNQFGNKRLKESFHKHVTNLPEQLKDKVREDLNLFIGSSEMNDDYTVVTVQFKN